LIAPRCAPNRAVHLAGADAGGGAVLGIDDGVRLDVLGDGPGEQAVGELLLGRRALGHDLEHVSSTVPLSRSWTSRPPAITDFTVRPPRAGSGRPPVSSRRRFFLRDEGRDRFFVGIGRDDHFGEDLGDRLAVGAVERRLTATMPPNADAVAGQRLR
jgi:hypothetical protein